MSKNQTGLRFQTQSKQKLKQIPVGKKQRLTIERLAHDGRGISQLNGKTWFVAGALPFEDIEARVLAVRNQTVDARCEQVFTAAANRQVPPCNVAHICGGCELQHLSYDDQISLKQQVVDNQFKKLAGITIDHWQPALTSKAFGYRRRARLAVHFNNQTKQLDIGFRAGASQQIINITDCMVLVDDLRQLLKPLVKTLRQLTNQQSIGHIELFSGTAISLLVRHVTPLADHDLTLLVDFCQEHNCQLWLQGKDHITAYAANLPLQYEVMVQNRAIKLNYQPADFVQVNALLNQEMINKALDWLAPKTTDTVLDLFSGLGNFSLPMALYTKQVVGIEAVSSMVERATQNAKQNYLDNTVFYQADLTLPLAGKPWAKQEFSLILLDPPREGALAIVKQLNDLATERILYISCNAATQARDARILLDKGYHIEKAIVMDMFPQTSHVETMLLFVKS